MLEFVVTPKWQITLFSNSHPIIEKAKINHSRKKKSEIDKQTKNNNNSAAGYTDDKVKKEIFSTSACYRGDMWVRTIAVIHAKEKHKHH